MVVGFSIIDVIPGYALESLSAKASANGKLRYGITKKTAREYLVRLRAHYSQSPKQAVSEYRAEKIFEAEVVVRR